MNITELKETLVNNDVEFTTNPFECIYILQDGTMIDGGFDMGSRGIDHNMISCCVPYCRYDDHRKFWDYVHHVLGLVRVVPEYSVCLLGIAQELTKEQQEIINYMGMEIERY